MNENSARAGRDPQIISEKAENNISQTDVDTLAYAIANFNIRDLPVHLGQLLAETPKSEYKRLIQVVMDMTEKIGEKSWITFDEANATKREIFNLLTGLSITEKQAFIRVINGILNSHTMRRPDPYIHTKEKDGPLGDPQ